MPRPSSGKAPKKFWGESFASAVLPETLVSDRDERQCAYHFAFQPAHTDQAEFDTRHASGQPRRVVWTRRALQDETGASAEMENIGLVLPDGVNSPPVFQNETDTARLGPSPGRSPHRLLEKILEGAMAWAWEMGGDGLFTYVSPGIGRVLGYSPEEIEGQPPQILLSREENAQFQKMVFDAAVSPGKRFSHVHQERNKKGDLLWIETSGNVFSDKTGIGSHGISIDITSLMALKEELYRREQEYRDLFDHTQVALLVTDGEFIVLNINQAGADMFGSSREEMTGRPLTDFMSEHDRGIRLKAYHRIYQRALAQEEKYVDVGIQLIRQRTEAGERCLRFGPKAVKIVSTTGGVTLLHTAVDVTESSTLQKELLKRKKLLERLVEERVGEIRRLQEEMTARERLATLGKLTAMVSHEIRNPLGTIQTSLYAVGERAKDKSLGITPAVDRAFRAIHRCDGIIEELLDFTRAKHLLKKPVDMESFLTQVLDSHEFPAGISVERKITSTRTLALDRDRVGRCLKNLLTNAVEAVSLKGDGGITIRAGEDGEGYEIVVSDTGVGIPKETMGKIFEPLYSTKHSGLGLGLSICKQVMELHGGAVGVRSEAGEGTVARLFFPIPCSM